MGALHRREWALEDGKRERPPHRTQYGQSRLGMLTSCAATTTTGSRTVVHHIHRELTKVPPVTAKWLHHRRVHLGRQRRWRAVKVEGEFGLCFFFLPCFSFLVSMLLSLFFFLPLRVLRGAAVTRARTAMTPRVPWRAKPVWALSAVPRATTSLLLLAAAPRERERIVGWFGVTHDTPPAANTDPGGVVGEGGHPAARDRGKFFSFFPFFFPRVSSLRPFGDEGRNPRRKGK